LPKIVLEEVYLSGVLIGEICVWSEDLNKPNHAGTGKTAKELMLADPDATGYTKDYIARLHAAGVLTLAEKTTATGKATH